VALLAPHRLACLEKYALSSALHTTRGDRFSPFLLCTLRPSEYQQIIDAFSSFICNFCMMLVMVKEADLNRIEVPGTTRSWMQRLWVGAWTSSGTRYLPTSPGSWHSPPKRSCLVRTNV